MPINRAVGWSIGLSDCHILCPTIPRARIMSTLSDVRWEDECWQLCSVLGLSILALYEHIMKNLSSTSMQSTRKPSSCGSQGLRVQQHSGNGKKPDQLKTIVSGCTESGGECDDHKCSPTSGFCQANMCLLHHFSFTWCPEYNCASRKWWCTQGGGGCINSLLPDWVRMTYCRYSMSHSSTNDIAYGKLCAKHSTP